MIEHRLLFIGCVQLRSRHARGYGLSVIGYALAVWWEKGRGAGGVVDLTELNFHHGCLTLTTSKMRDSLGSRFLVARTPTYFQHRAGGGRARFLWQLAAGACCLLLER